MRRLLLPVLVLFALAAAPSSSGAQEMAVRFEMGTVRDTLFTFNIGNYAWVAPGQQGIVVDPRRRDALIARFRIARVEGATATAVVTGLAAPLATHHAVLITQPAKPWYRQRSFWAGTVAGTALGFLLGSL